MILFDRSKPFYPYVVNYLASLHGMIELISRNCYSQIEKVAKSGHSVVEFISEQANGDEKIVKYYTDIIALNYKPTVLIGELALRSEQRNKPVEISIDEIAKDFVENHIFHLPFQIKPSGILLLMAYESSPDTKLIKSNHLWNFLYHCRNAVAHNGKFKINEQGKKRLPAKWGNLEILESMDGVNLFKDGTTSQGLLSPGDSIYLLYDIEQTCF